MPFPGVFPVALFGAAAAGLTTLSQVASATSIGNTITGPAGIQAGDLLVLWDVAANAGATTPTTVVPTGFTSIANLVTDVEVRSILSTKIADGSEASASLTGMNGNSENNKALYVFRGNVPILTATPTDVATEGQNGNPAAQTVNASGATVPLVVLAGYYTAGAAVDPRTFTPAKDGEVNPEAWMYLAYKLYNAAPADVTVDMDDEGTRNVLVSCYLACA